MKRYVMLGLLSLVLLAGCSGRQPAVKNPGNEAAVTPSAPDTAPQRAARTFPARVSDAGSVVIEVRPLNLGQPEDTLHFQVAMNTHSVELDYDLARMAALRTNRGDEVTPSRRDGARGGHHVNGILYFPAMDLKGVQWAELVIRDVASVPERTFRWELSP